ncbi:MAG: M23 family metallopeptidase, partial [Clostridia bacterium]|nr:M23 family metallopeptidase [Clostridia bacterium]
AWMMENAYWITIGCVLAIVAGCALYTEGLQDAKGVQAAADAPEIRESIPPTSAPVLTPLPTIAPLSVRPAALVQRGGAWPVQGKVIRACDPQQSVHWETLGLWQTHNGLDIEAKTGEYVLACMDGTIIGAAWDVLWGWRILIEHDDGCQMRYAGLESCAVRSGEQVRRGQMIGTVLERIPCEGEIETHLHLEMMKDGKYQDPEAILAER